MDYTQFTPNPRKNKHLPFKERVRIELLAGEGKTVYAIAKLLNRPINTITNELKRGTVDQIKQWMNGLPRKILGYKTPEELFEEELDLIYAL